MCIEARMVPVGDIILWTINKFDLFAPDKTITIDPQLAIFISFQCLISWLFLLAFKKFSIVFIHNKLNSILGRI